MANGKKSLLLFVCILPGGFCWIEMEHNVLMGLNNIAHSDTTEDSFIVAPSIITIHRCEIMAEI